MQRYHTAQVGTPRQSYILFKAPLVSKGCEARIKVLFGSDYSFVGVPQGYICGLAEIIDDDGRNKDSR